MFSSSGRRPTRSVQRGRDGFPVSHPPGHSRTGTTLWKLLMNLTVLYSKDSNALFLWVFGLLFTGMIQPWIINNPTLITFRLPYFQSVSMQTLDATCTLSNYFQMNSRVFRILDFSSNFWFFSCRRHNVVVVGGDVKMQAARQETARWQQPLQALVSPELLPPLTCLQLTFFPLYQTLWFERLQAIGFNPLGKLCPPTWPSVA